MAVNATWISSNWPTWSTRNDCGYILNIWEVLLCEHEAKCCSVDFSLLNKLWAHIYCTILPLVWPVSFVLMSFSQLTLFENMTVANQGTLKLPASEAVHPIMTFDPSDSNYLYIMTSHHVRFFAAGEVSVLRFLLMLLTSVTDLVMSAWRRIIKATIRPHFTSTSPQFSWTHTDICGHMHRLSIGFWATFSDQCVSLQSSSRQDVAAPSAFLLYSGNAPDCMISMYLSKL